MERWLGACSPGRSRLPQHPATTARKIQRQNRHRTGVAPGTQESCAHTPWSERRASRQSSWRLPEIHATRANQPPPSSSLRRARGRRAFPACHGHRRHRPPRGQACLSTISSCLDPRMRRAPCAAPIAHARAKQASNRARARGGKTLPRARAQRKRASRERTRRHRSQMPHALAEIVKAFALGCCHRHCLHRARMCRPRRRQPSHGPPALTS